MLKLKELQAAVTDKVTLQGKLDAALTEIGVLKTDLQTSQDLATAETARAEALAGEIASANTSIEQLTGQVADLEKGKKTLAASTVEKLHELGVPAAELPSASTAGADDEATYAEWKSLSGGEKTKYFREHRAALGRFAAAE